MGSWIEYDNQLHLLDYLRNKYKGCKIVWFLQDLIATRRMHDGSSLFMDDLKNKLDMIFSFDQKDCKKYGLIYHHLVFSSYENEVDERPDSDVYFLGKAKNRHKDIIKVYEILKGRGLKCDFHIAGVPIEEQAYRDEIDYEPHISYKENLQRILHTKCLLELMQKGGVGFTQRGCEAVCLNKKLLTNNPEIKNAPFYNSEYISCFSDVKDIDINFIEEIRKDMVVDYNYKYNFSPIKLLEFIDEKLN